MKSKLGSAWRSLKIDYEYAVVLVSSATIAVLSLLDVIEDVKPLAASTLAVLSVMAFGFLRQSRRRDDEAATAENMSNDVRHLTELVESLRETTRTTKAIEEVPGRHQRNQTFEEALLDPQFWYFRGSTGIFLRAKTLGAVSAASRHRAGSNSVVTIQILDPSNRESCERYVAHRRRLNEQRGEPVSERWTVRRIQLECLATAVAAAWYSQHENLQVTVGLTDNFSTLRLDLSDKVAIITSEDPSYPALALRPASKLYFMVKNDLERSLEGCRLLDTRHCAAIPRDRNAIDPVALRPYLESVGPFSDLTEAETELIVELALDRTNDYASRS